MKIKKIYINFEGVLADFEGRVKVLWGIASPDDDCTLDEYYRFWERIRNEKHFYESLTPLPGSLEMVKNLYETYGNICEIVSEKHYIFDPNLKKSFGVEDEDVCAAKTEWVQKFLAIDIKSEWLFGGAVNCKNAGYILIDCRDEKIKEWQMHGGTGILYSNPQETLRELRNIEEAFSRQNEKKLADKLEQAFRKCKEDADRIEALYSSGLETGEGVRNEKVQIAQKAWNEIKKFCDDEGIDLDAEKDTAYPALYSSVGIHIKKVPIRHYPQVKFLTGSMYCFYGVKNIESLFSDSDFVGKIYKFKISSKLGEESILLDYFFEVKEENLELEERSQRNGWKCFDGYGKLEGYKWAGASLHIREHEGQLQSVAIQKIYLSALEPIWKRCSARPVEEYRWVGFNEELPENLEIPEGEFYFDATTNPPRGRHYREQGILVYDDTDEVVILGIKDSNAEIVEIPREINGKPVTILDERCFANCSENLRKVILPDTLKEIGDCAFEHCKKLEKPEIPASVTKIGKDLFGPVFV